MTAGCILPACELNKDHTPVEILMEPTDICERIQDCVTVTIKTKHRLQQVAQLIKSIHDFYPDTKIIVADEFYPEYERQSPLAWKQQYLKGPSGLVTYFQTRPGVGYGRHLAAQMATTKYVLVSDDDYIFTNRTYVDVLLRVLEQTDLSIAGGVVDDKYAFDGAIRVWQPNNKSAHLTVFPQVFHENLNRVENCFVSDIIKNFFLAKKDNILRAGGWDLDRMYYEHEDFFLQMRNKRLKVAHCPEVMVKHDTKDRKLADDRRKTFKRWSTSLKEKWGFSDYYYCDRSLYFKSDGCTRTRNFAK